MAVGIETPKIVPAAASEATAASAASAAAVSAAARLLLPQFAPN